MSRNRFFAAAAIAAVLFALALGFHQAGSPHIQRLAHADEARLNDLNVISRLVSDHYALFHKLPQSLTELGGSAPALRLNDPVTRIAYEYRPLDERRFELCAVFSTENRTEGLRPPSRVHAAGRQCFSYPE